MLLPMIDLLNEARKGGYAVAAPNVWNEENTRDAIAAAEEMNAPVILDYVYNPRVYDFMLYAKPLCERSRVPIAINQDHGRAFEHAMHCLRAGFTSIMVDRSSLPFEDNVEQVREIVKVAHALGVTVEAELGHVGQGNNYEVDGNSNFTDPDQAAEYIERTGCDALAVAIGTAHGNYSGVPKLHFDILENICKAVSIPLVLHGGSGTGEENLYKATHSGINKVNLNTDLQKGAVTKLREADILGKNRLTEVERTLYAGHKEALMHYMELFGSKDKA